MELPFVWVMTPVVGVLLEQTAGFLRTVLALLDQTEQQLVVPTAMCVVCHVPVAEDAGRYRTHPGAIKAAFIVL
jgi:hypothetical protein